MKEFIKRTLTGALLVASFCGAYLHSSLLFALFIGVIFLVILHNEWPYLLPVRGFGGILLSLLYPGLSMMGILSLHLLYRATDFYLPLYPFFIAWAADTCGYLVGKLIGNHKICPTISPGKSWEGLLGSFIGVVGINFLILPKIEASFAAMVSSRIGYMLAFSAALTVVAFLGGLLLSVLKRSKNLKDAGNVLPGHGGFLDRFDSVFSVILIVWLLIFIPIFLAQSQDFYTLWLRLADSIEMHAKAAMAFIQTSVQQVLKLFKK